MSIGGTPALGAALALGSALLPAGEPDWLQDDGRVLEMRLAHREADRVDGGTLRVDRARRLVTWQGAPNEVGCRRPWESSFVGVGGVKVDAPGFVIVLRQGPVKEMRLAPLPHFAELLGKPHIGGVAPNVKEALKGPDGDPVPLGGSGASTTPSVGRVPASPSMQRDTRRAVSAILDALGRPER